LRCGLIGGCTWSQLGLRDLTHQRDQLTALIGWQQPIDGHLALLLRELLAQSRSESAYFVVARRERHLCSLLLSTAARDFPTLAAKWKVLAIVR
jgi:hypothetical protein